MLSLDHAIVYDIETTLQCFSFAFEYLNRDEGGVFEISPYRDDRTYLLAWFEYWRANSVPMIGFNSLAFDYQVIHQIWSYPYIAIEEIYSIAQQIIHSQNRFGGNVWESDRFAPQIDLLKLHHMDNPAKMTSLKALQVAMRSETVLEMPLPFDQALTADQIRDVLIPYNKHDVSETKKFARISMDAINFRLSLAATLRGDVLNMNDTKIGAKILEQRLGDDLCYSWESGRKAPRQTIRHAIPLADIIFPYVRFDHPEFARVLEWMRTQTLTADELSTNGDGGQQTHYGSIKTKGVFTGVHATVGGLDFHFGTGGIHGSVTSQRFVATEDRAIVDVDVTGLYPSIAIVNRLYPEHLGEAFVREYAQLPIERAKHKKGTVQNALFKLAANGTYGNSNNRFSVFYDPKFTMAITINGQLMLCMLAEALLAVPTLSIVAINTDGITYTIHPSLIPYTRRVRSNWEALTRLTLEEVQYSRMWIRDVNNYVAETTDGKLKQKGAYWFPRKFPEDITNAAPPAWHKDFSASVAVKAAVEHMVTGVDIERVVYGHADKFDFMCRAKCDRSSELWIGDRQVQRITRYYVAHSGGQMRKVSPPVKGAKVGDWKRRNGVGDFEFARVIAEIGPGQWDERIHTKNRSKYIVREIGIETGYNVADCNNAADFDFENVNYQYYIDQAKRLVI